MSQNTQNLTPAGETPLLSWSARSYHIHDRGPGWYTRAGIIAAIIAIYAIVTGAWTFAVVVLLGVGVYFLVHDHEPAPKSIALLDNGLRYEGRFWGWNTFKGYFLKSTPAFTELHVLPGTGGGPKIVLQTGDTDLRALREILNAHIEQLSDAEESLLDSFIRFCKL